MTGRVQRVFQAVALSGVAALLGLLVYSFVREESGRGLVSKIAKGERPAAPDFSLPVVEHPAGTWSADLVARASSGSFGSADLEGTPYVVNFYASWCLPCRDEAKLLAESAAQNRDKVVFLGIAFQDLERDTRQFADRFGINFGIVRDPGSKVAKRFGLTGVPETFFVDKDGHIVAHKPGSVDADELALGTRAALSGKAVELTGDTAGIELVPAS
jgi:cytochrome c biogenesis protein CcmG/thiol:disulfide interchange protein DsbE